jgi:hypothetical protein
LAERELGARVRAHEVRTSPDGDAAAAAAFGATARRPLGGMFLAFALVALLIEAFLASARRQVQRAA